MDAQSNHERDRGMVGMNTKATRYVIQSDATDKASVLYGPAMSDGLWGKASELAEARQESVYIVAVDVPCAIGFRVDPEGFCYFSGFKVQP